MQMWDSATDYINRLKDTVQQINNDRLTFRWRLQKIQQDFKDKKDDSVSMLIRAASAELEGKAINYKDSFGLYLLHQNYLTDRTLYDSAIRIANDLYQLSKRNDSFQLPVVDIELARLYTNLNDRGKTKKYLGEGWSIGASGNRNPFSDHGVKSQVRNSAGIPANFNSMPAYFTCHFPIFLYCCFFVLSSS